MGPGSPGSVQVLEHILFLMALKVFWFSAFYGASRSSVVCSHAYCQELHTINKSTFGHGVNDVTSKAASI